MDLLETGLPLTDKMLYTIYEYGPCAFCRHNIVEELHKRGKLTEAQLAECIEDADSDTREYAVRVSGAEMSGREEERKRGREEERMRG